MDSSLLCITVKVLMQTNLLLVEWMSDIWDKVDSTIIHNCWCSTNILQISYQNSEANIQDENEVHDFAEEDECISIYEN